MWLGEKITDKGIGNGISILIMIGIIASLPQALVFEFTSQINQGGLRPIRTQKSAILPGLSEK